MMALRDVNAPPRFIEGDVHWQMASGANAVDVCITASALHLLGPRPLPAYLDVLQQHRPVLCEIAALKFTMDHRSRPAQVRLDRKDIAALLVSVSGDERPEPGSEKAEA